MYVQQRSGCPRHCATTFQERASVNFLSSTIAARLVIVPEWLFTWQFLYTRNYVCPPFPCQNHMFSNISCSVSSIDSWLSYNSLILGGQHMLSAKHCNELKLCGSFHLCHNYLTLTFHFSMLDSYSSWTAK